MLTYLIVLLPILYQIKSPINVISLGELLLIPFMIKALIKKYSITHLKINVPKGLVGFYFVPIITTIIASSNSFFDFFDAITIIIRIIFYFILIILAQDYFNYEKGLNFYYVITMICFIYIVLQVLMHRIMNFDLPIPANFPQILKSEVFITDVKKYYSYFGFRPASFFTEPSYYADFFMPILFILLFNKDVVLFGKKITNIKRVIIAIMYSLGILLSTSSLGVVYLVVAWGTFIFLNYSSMKVNSYAKILIIFLVFSLVLYVFKSSTFAYTLKRVANGSSMGARLIRGFIIFDNLNIFQKIFGIGLNNIGNYVIENGIKTIYDEQNLNYTVTLTNRLIATGFVGTLSLIYFSCVQFFRRSKANRAMLIAMVVSFIFANGEYTYGFAFFYIWFLQIDKQEKSLNVN